MNKILLSHGSGGQKTHDLIAQVFARHFSNSTLNAMGDSAVLNINSEQLAFTTDAFVVKPIKFPGGDIGKLAICGTVNDLAVAGATPLFISTSFIIEEGTEIALIDEIAFSMGKTAKEAGVQIVAGDTKVVEKGSCDTVFITTSGIGKIITKEVISAGNIKRGDAILINGEIADHGMAIMAAREGLSIETNIQSDCAPLNDLVKTLIEKVPSVRFMRDATRGGLGAVLCEACHKQNFGIEINEDNISINEGTQAACEILGIDPIYVANEGKLVAFVPGNEAQSALAALKGHPLGKKAAIIGRVTGENSGKVSLITTLGTKRLILMPTGDQLPRIC